MKKFLVLFLSMAFLFACSNDDDNEVPQEADPIVGTWALVQMTPPAIDFTACEDTSTITLNADKTGSGSFYFQETECVEQTSSGNWVNNGNSSYTIAVPYLGNITGTANFTGDDEFTFTSNSVGVLRFEKL